MCMKYRLPRQLLSSEIAEIISREMKKQELCLLKFSKSHIEELEAVITAIQKRGLPSYLVCKKLPHNLGYGIFLHPKAKPILKGQVIAPYAGEVSIVYQDEPDEATYAFAPMSEMHLTKDEQKIFDQKRKYHPRRRYALKLDGEKKGNFTRYINHSSTPNVEASLLSIKKAAGSLLPMPLEIVYFAKKRILPGEQLLVSYEGEDNSYWTDPDFQPFPMTPKTFQIDKDLKLIEISKK